MEFQRVGLSAMALPRRHEDRLGKDAGVQRRDHVPSPARRARHGKENSFAEGRAVRRLVHGKDVTISGTAAPGTETSAEVGRRQRFQVDRLRLRRRAVGERVEGAEAAVAKKHGFCSAKEQKKNIKLARGQAESSTA